MCVWSPYSEAHRTRVRSIKARQLGTYIKSQGAVESWATHHGSWAVRLHVFADAIVPVPVNTESDALVRCGASLRQLNASRRYVPPPAATRGQQTAARLHHPSTGPKSGGRSIPSPSPPSIASGQVLMSLSVRFPWPRPYRATGSAGERRGGGVATPLQHCARTVAQCRRGRGGVSCRPL